MKNFKKSNSKGFTIIEVLIVLAIAGLILLVVFLAVPALQRNQRNQAARSEANRLLGAVQEVTNNNGGTTVSTAGDITKILASANLKTVTALNIVPVASTLTTATPPSATQVTFTTSTLFTGAKCSGQSNYIAGQPRQSALMYAVEDNAGVVVVQCLES